MARPRQFDRKQVLDQVTQLFWENGFDGASIQDLCNVTGLGRASLYGSFGSKEALVEEAMDTYIEGIRDRIFEGLHRAGRASDVLREFFGGIVAQRGFGENVKACLITKAALMKRTGHDGVVAKAVQFMQEVEDELYFVLLRGRTEGDISPAKDPRSMARYFVTILQGLSVVACTRPEALAESVDIALWSLD